MTRLRMRLLIGLVVAVALAFGASPDLRAAAKAGAKATAKAATKAATATAKAAKATMGGGTAQKTQSPGQTVKDKKQLAIDRQAAAKTAAAKGFTVTAFGTAAMATPGTAPHYFSMPNWANSPLPVVQTAGVPTTVGNATNADRAFATDYPVAAGSIAPVFVVVPSAVLPAGTLTSFQAWNQATGGGSPFASAGNLFHAYVLRPTGTAGQYLVAFDSGTLVVPPLHSPGVSELVSYPTAPFAVLAGDVIGFSGQGIPLDTGGTNADILSYPAPTAPIAGAIITIPSTDFPLLSTDRTYSLAATVLVSQTKIGGGIRKFVDQLPGVPGLTQFSTVPPAAGDPARPTEANNLGQAIPQAVPQGWPLGCAGTACVADYYEIGLVQTREKMHSDLPPTLLREYVQLSTDGTGVPLSNANLDPTKADTPIATYKGLTAPHYLGPLIVATKDRPVRIKFRNLLPTGEAGNLFLPVDTTFMGAGRGPNNYVTPEPDPLNPTCGQTPKDPGCFTENRATLHLHGGNTPWISDGTPHQWITPASEAQGYPKGVSVRNVPDMGNDCDAPGSGCQTFYYTNQQSARMLFYHDHAFGITRLNVYAGEAAGYVITDGAEQALISGPLKDVGYGIPLVIQDRTFVPNTAQLAATDPLWDLARWGGEGSLWLPHVYMPIQSPGSTAPSQFGRWFYGPWFWPPVSPLYGAVTNPYYDPSCNPNVMAFCEPATMPGTPYLSTGMEAFHDTPVVNGTAYPTVTLEPKAYRFRILNAANDRFFNLQWYVAVDAKGVPCTPGATITPESTGVACSEVALNAAQVLAAQTDPAGVIPLVDTAKSAPGPSWLQIGTEGGFLPAPAVVPNQEITYVTDPGRFDVGNVDLHSLLLGSAERADVIVDFSRFAGQTLILYNDAPAAFPARDPRYDYFSGNADQRDVGGAPSTLPGYGPNTRTVMQVKIAAATTTPAVVDQTLLENAFKSASLAGGGGLFESSQHPIVVGQAAYNSAYGTNFPATGWCNDPTLKTLDPTLPSTQTALNTCDGFVRMFEQGGDLFGFNTLKNALDIRNGVAGATWTKIAIPLQPKGMHDEPNAAAFDEYGRMTANLGLEAKGATPLLQNIILYPYPNPPTELIDGTKLPKAPAPGIQVQPIAAADDGTQIWKITHNGVDTHPIHFHLYDVQVLDRAPWDGQTILPPDPSELGWKDTVRISPLEDTYVAVRPVVPQVPFDLPNSIRLLNPMMPEGSDIGFNNVDINGNPTNPILNVPVNFGWEYVWHCHILSHEEMDMMRPQSLVMPPNAPTFGAGPINYTVSGNSLIMNWDDTSLNETAYVVQRNDGLGWVDIFTMTSPTPDTKGPSLTYTEKAYSTTSKYRVVAQNTVGYGGQFPSLTAQAASAEFVPLTVTTPAAPTNLVATVQAGPQVLLAFKDNATNESGFVIERCTMASSATPCTNFAQVGSAPAVAKTGNTSFTDTTVVLGTSYMYRVAAINGSGLSGYSNTVTANLPAAPAAPTSVKAANKPTTNNQRSVTLTWTAGAGTVPVSGYTVQRATDSAFTAGLTTTNLGNVLTTTVTGLSRNTSYYFRVRANNGIATSGWVNAAPFPILTLK